jgi:hypothetical protein
MLQLPKSFRISSDKESHLLAYIKDYQRRVFTNFELEEFQFLEKWKFKIFIVCMSINTYILHFDLKNFAYTGKAKIFNEA